jgi:hypothetical protein
MYRQLKQRLTAPLTEADRAVEETLHAAINHAHPSHGIDRNILRFVPPMRLTVDLPQAALDRCFQDVRPRS